MSRYPDKPALKLVPRLQGIVGQDYPRFSKGELERRRGLMAKAMAQAGLEHLVAYASFFRGGPVHWLSDWLTTYEAVLVFTPGRPKPAHRPARPVACRRVAGRPWFVRRARS